MSGSAHRAAQRQDRSLTRPNRSRSRSRCNAASRPRSVQASRGETYLQYLVSEGLPRSLAHRLVKFEAGLQAVQARIARLYTESHTAARLYTGSHAAASPGSRSPGRASGKNSELVVDSQGSMESHGGDGRIAAAAAPRAGEAEGRRANGGGTWKRRFVCTCGLNIDLNRTTDKFLTSR